MEIEKKYLLQALPFSLDNFPCIAIIQGYISTDPVIRIRQANDDFILTIKGPGLMAREEHELQLTELQFNALLKKCSFLPIYKKRYLIPLETFTLVGSNTSQLIIELDVFERHLSGLILAEIEFSSMEEATSFMPPTWLKDDVTEDRRYQNSYLCQVNELFER